MSLEPKDKEVKRHRHIGNYYIHDSLRYYTLKVAAPYIAVIIGLYIFHNAWLSIILYHGQIIFWWALGHNSSKKIIYPLDSNLSFHRFHYKIHHGLDRIKKLILQAILPISALAGVTCYILLPSMLRETGSLTSGLSLWLNQNNLIGIALLLLIPYFGIIHPFIEQLHWQPLTSPSHPYAYISHLTFAAYHALVIYPILQPVWTLLCVVALACISILWGNLRHQKNKLYMVYLSHMLADLGIIIATYIRSQ